MEAQHLSEALEGFLVRPDNGWFTPIAIAVSGLSAEQAARAPAPRFNSVWAIVNHVRFWHQYALLRLQSQPVDRQALGSETGWPPAGEPPDEQAWQADCQRLFSVNAELAALAAQYSTEELDQPYAPGRAKRFQVLHGVIAHNSYHTCEIISVRHMQGWWLEDT